mgnify:FL=1
MTLHFGEAGDKLGAHFWNGQDALNRWSVYTKNTTVDHAKYFTEHQCPRLISVLPPEQLEAVGELDASSTDLDDVNMAHVASPRELFPHINLNKKSIERVPIVVPTVGKYEPFHAGLQTKGQFIDDILEKARYFAEECDYLGTIQVFSGDDQYGGLGANVMESLMDDFEKKLFLVFSVPSVDLKSSWESKALALYSYKDCHHVPFAMMKPDDLEWSVNSYEPFPIFASAIDTIQSHEPLPFITLPKIGSIAYGMRMESENHEKEKVEPVIDLMSFASPGFYAVSCRSDRKSVPSYVKVNNHGYIAHHTTAAYGVPQDLESFMQDICSFIKTKPPGIDRDLHEEMRHFLLSQSE